MLVLVVVCFAGRDCPAASLPRFELTQISDNAGRLAWYTGAAHELIAFDAIIDRPTAATEVFVMQADGSGVRCVTCAMDIPKYGGFVGQPSWHPDGEHLVIQVENGNSRHTRFNHMSWGIDADLWIIALDGRRAEHIWTSAPYHAALHAHFSPNGNWLVFAERVRTPRVARRLFHPWAAIGGQNPWDGWSIHLAAFDVDASGAGMLTYHRRIGPNGSGFYETHGISNDGRIVYSHTGGGAAYVDDIYLTNSSESRVTRLVYSPKTWDEHGAYSPNGRNLAFVSSRADRGWRAPASKPDTLTTELFIRSADGVIHQLTSFNSQSDGDTRYLVSDFDWDRSGSRIAFQLAPVSASGEPAPPQIWLLEFETADAAQSN